MIKVSTHTRAQTHTELQHVSDGPQPIFGLAGARADWVQAVWKMRGLRALERGDGTRPIRGWYERAIITTGG